MSEKSPAWCLVAGSRNSLPVTSTALRFPESDCSTDPQIIQHVVFPFHSWISCKKYFLSSFYPSFFGKNVSTLHFLLHVSQCTTRPSLFLAGYEEL